MKIMKKYLKDTHPQLLNELVDNVDLSKVTTGSGKKLLWKCSNGHEWYASVSDRTRTDRPTGCPYCSGNKVLSNFNSVAVKRPESIGLFQNEEDAYKYSVYSHKRLTWKCNQGHFWENSICNVIGRNTKCPYCSGKIISKENSLGVLCPDIADELVDGSLKYKLSLKSNKKVKWKCSVCGYIYDAYVYNRTSGHGCPCCAGNVRRVGVNDLYTLYPELSSELLDSDLAYDLGPSSEIKVSWKCSECNNVYTMSPASRVRSLKESKSKNSCPYCNGRLIKRGFNDVATLYPTLLKEAVCKNDLFIEGKSSRKKILWKCSNGHEWYASIANRTNGTGCPVCAIVDSVTKEESDFSNVICRLVPDLEIVKSDRSFIAPKELDVMVPDLKIAFEYNGVIWHSNRFHENFETQHYDKYLLVKDKDYQLVQIWSDDWRIKRDTVIYMLAYKLHALNKLSEVVLDFDNKLCEHIGARKLTASLGLRKDVFEFLNKYHINGFIDSSYHFVLKDSDGDVRAVLSVFKLDYTGDWEVQRFSVKGIIPGAFTKLLKFAEKYILKLGLDLDRWVSFSSNDISNGNLYLKSGFVEDEKISADYMYIDSKDQWKRKFKNDVQNIDGLYRVYDAGKIKWIKYINK